MPTLSRYTNPFMIQPIAAWMWALCLGILLITVDFAAGMVQVLPASLGMFLLALAGFRLRDDCFQTRVAAAARILLYVAAVGIAVELPRSVNLYYGGILHLAHQLFSAGVYAAIGWLFFAIGRECAEHGFGPLGGAWQFAGGILIAALGIPWAISTLMDIGRIPLPENFDRALATGTQILTTASIPAAAILWLLTARAARSEPAERRDIGGAACARCGYDLRGLSSALCPECGAEQR